MRRILWILLLLVCGSVHAQLLPIIFDQAITLPEETDIWDVMPHPDGYYVWVAANEPDTEQTRIYWGRTDTGENDFFDLSIGAPHQLFAYWAESHEASCILVSRLVWTYDSEEMDSTDIHRVRLVEGTDSLLWRYVAYSGPGPWFIDHLTVRDYHIAAFLPLPYPPAMSLALFAEIGLFNHSFDVGEYVSTSTASHAGMICRNLLTGPYPSYAFPDYNGPGLWGDAVVLDTVIFVASTGNRFSEYWPPVPPTPHYAVGAGLRRVTASSDTAIASWSTDGQVTAEPVACTVDSITETAIGFTEEVGVCGAIGGDGIFWTTSTAYSHWLAADVVPNNGHEEFLCYDPSRQVFDILDPVDGHSYGSSTVCGIMNSGAKIISRYDSTFRRLALRSGNQLQLYRFGEYLSVGDPLIVPRSSLIVSNYPNPFNSTTEIRFDLPQAAHVTLRVFDITGREVATLQDEMIVAGSHAVDFDASSLPSGVYTYRLTTGHESLARKMVLLR